MSAAQRVTRAAMREYFPHGGLGRRIVALPAYGCVYVKNLKAGCSTVSLWLHRIHTGDHAFTPETARHREFGLPRPGQIGWDRVERMLSGSAFRFTFVRDPARRAESAYRDKVLGATDDRYRRHVRASLGLDGGGPVSLEMFVTSLEQQEPLDMDAHWRPQHLNLMHPLVTYDLIGRLESFTEDLKAGPGRGWVAGCPRYRTKHLRRTSRGNVGQPSRPPPTCSRGLRPRLRALRLLALASPSVRVWLHRHP